jgi:hypothetical protein
VTGSAIGDAVADAASWERERLWTSKRYRDTWMRMDLERLLAHWNPPPPPTARIEVVFFVIGVVLGVLWVWHQYA